MPLFVFLILFLIPQGEVYLGGVNKPETEYTACEQKRTRYLEMGKMFLATSETRIVTPCFAVDTSTLPRCQ